MDCLSFRICGIYNKLEKTGITDTHNRAIRCFILCSQEDSAKAIRISKYLDREDIETMKREDWFLPEMTIRENLHHAVNKIDFVILLAPQKTEQQEIFFETRMLVGMGKPLFALAEEHTESHLSYVLSSILYLKYTPEKTEKSLENIRNWDDPTLQNHF